MIERGKESESSGKYQEALNYYREAERISSDVLVIGLISEVGKKIKEEEEKKGEEEEQRKKEKEKKKLSAYKRRKKVIIELVAILIIIACGLSLYGYNIWQQKQFNRFVAEAEQLFTQKKYSDSLRKVEEALKYGSKAKSEKLALLIEKLEGYREVLKSKDEMEKSKATLDIDVIKELNLERNYEILVSQEAKGAKAFESDQFKEAKDIFEKTRVNYASLIDKIAELQKTEQQRIEELEKAALKIRDEMEGAKKGINTALAKQYAGKEYQFSISQEQNGIRAFESGRLKEAMDFFEAAKIKYSELPNLIVRQEKGEKEASKVKDDIESTKKRVDTQLAQRYVGREYNELISQEKKGIDAFRSGQFKEAKDIFEVVKVKYSDLPDRIAKLRKAEEERAEKERFEKLRQDATKARSEAEGARNNVDMKLVEKFGFKQEYNTLLSQESKGKEAFEATRHGEAKDIFEKVKSGYSVLVDKINGLQKTEEEHVEKERTEKLRQEAARAKDKMESAKSKVDFNLAERYGFKEQVKSLLSQESQGRKVLDAGRFQDAIEIFERLCDGFKSLDKNQISSAFKVDVNPASLNLGTISSGSSPKKIITITNSGKIDTGIKSVRTEPPGRLLIGIHECRNIRPGNSCNMYISSTSGYGYNTYHYHTDLIIIFNDPMSSEVRIPIDADYDGGPIYKSPPGPPVIYRPSK